MGLLLGTFWDSYGILIILLVAFGAIMLYYFFRNKKFTENESQFQNSLRVGDKVKTYSGFYGTIAKITNTTDGKVITLKLGENAYIDVDIRALMGLDTKTEVKESPVAPLIADMKEKEAREKLEASLNNTDQKTQDDASKNKDVNVADKNKIVAEPENNKVSKEKPTAPTVSDVKEPKAVETKDFKKGPKQTKKAK